MELNCFHQKRITRFTAFISQIIFHFIIKENKECDFQSQKIRQRSLKLSDHLIAWIPKKLLTFHCFKTRTQFLMALSFVQKCIIPCFIEITSHQSICYAVSLSLIIFFIKKFKYNFYNATILFFSYPHWASTFTIPKNTLRC